jgi:DNA-binding MarR family transcriptional regulator
MADVDGTELERLIHGEMAPGFIGLLLGRIVDRLVEEGVQPAREAGIAAPPRTFSMIMLLARASQTVTELAQRLGVTHAAVIKTERMLEKLGLVERGQDAGDARRKPLCLTAQGEAEAERIAKFMARVNRVYAELFDEIGVDLFAAARAFDAALDREGFAERYRRI